MWDVNDKIDVIAVFFLSLLKSLFKNHHFVLVCIPFHIYITYTDSLSPSLSLSLSLYIYIYNHIYLTPLSQQNKKKHTR